MIVRISGEAQYRIEDEELPRLEALDQAVVNAAASGNRESFGRRFAELLEAVRSGEMLADAHLGPSDAILPPPDISLEEATREFSGEGLLPT